MNELHPQPLETLWDAGPRHRGGAGLVLLAMLFTLVFGLVLVAGLGGKPGPDWVFLLIMGVIFGVPGGWAWWRILQSRGGGGLPPGPYFLVEQLKFTIPRPLNDVALTAFFRPETVRPGEATCLLVFLENYSARRRHVKLTLGKCAALVTAGRELELVLGAGQAAVYRWPLQLQPGAAIREYELVLKVQVKAPHGPGKLLPAVSGRTYSSSSLLLVSSAFRLNPTFNVVAGPSGVPGPLAASAYLSLSTPAGQPRFDLVRQISEARPDQAITIEPPLV